jgi:hypothetical protein
MANGYFAPMRDDKKDIPAYWVPYIRLTLADADTGATLENDVVALIDTGSEACWIDHQLIKKYGLVQQGSIPAYTPTGATTNGVYRCHFIIPDLPRNKSIVMLTIGGDFSASGMNHRMLLGLDALRFFDFRLLRNPDIVELKWAVPA